MKALRASDCAARSAPVTEALCSPRCSSAANKRPGRRHVPQASNFFMSAAKLNIENVLKRPLTSAPSIEQVQDVAEDTAAVISNLLSQVEDMWHQYAAVRKLNLKLQEDMDSLQSDLHRTRRALQQERRDKEVIQKSMDRQNVS